MGIYLHTHPLIVPRNLYSWPCMWVYMVSRIYLHTQPLIVPRNLYSWPCMWGIYLHTHPLIVPRNLYSWPCMWVYISLHTQPLIVCAHSVIPHLHKQTGATVVRQKPGKNINSIRQLFPVNCVTVVR